MTIPHKGDAVDDSNELKSLNEVYLSRVELCSAAWAKGALWAAVLLKHHEWTARLWEPLLAW
jgi:hypothetical protein